MSRTPVKGYVAPFQVLPTPSSEITNVPFDPQSEMVQ